ncbi:hypothetical protein [Brevundimonas sp.]|uniref:hypothetical protein n=1 Tax=Brevundimonas sp. TaxID=1871086 RepID=UPI0025E80ACF|nr:hypothetical protein [Brevundimonas sp.]
MRVLIGVSVLSLFLAAGPAQAGPAQVEVFVGDDLADQADEYGQRDLDLLTERLDREVETALARSGLYEDARIRLVIEDVRPNRPTFEQLRRRPGLSLESHGIGGADISGEVVTADGQTVPITFRWYESDIRFAGLTTWSDANQAFSRFARRLAEGRF